MTTPILLALFGLAMVPVEIMWSGYVLTFLWMWFIVPLFGLPPLSIAQAMGLGLVIAFLTHQHIKSTGHEGQDKELLRTIAIVMARPAFALFLGWIIKAYI